MFLYFSLFFIIMTSNDPIILDSTIKQKKDEIGSDFSEADFFEIFTSEQMLKNYELSYEDLCDGKVGNGNDGGIDGFYFFINGEYILEEIDPNNHKKKPILELFIIQSKRSLTFSEDAFQKINTTIQDLFDLSKDMDKLTSFYNEDLLEKAKIFRNSYLALASKHPLLRINYVYATKGNTSEIHVKVKNEAELVKANTIKHFSGSEVNYSFFGAKELLELSRVEKTYTLTLNYIESVLSKGEDNYVLLTNLEDYYKFVTDENNHLRNYIFESNVRDFQGYVEVNKDIIETLNHEKKLDFWWLNNGITILASKASVTGKTITLDDVQIINGLQTTNCIWQFFNDNAYIADTEKNKSLLVKILIIDNPDSRDKIIKATNFQTSIPPASLKATEKIQRDIEDYFKTKDLFYDRRKNYYKNIGKAANKIISIPLLAQTVNSIIRKDPHASRARPASLLKNKETYDQLFNDTISPDTYLLCGQIIKKIESRFKDHLEGYTSQEKRNLKFQITMSIIAKLTEKINYHIEDLKDLTIDDLTNDNIDKITKEVIELTRNYMRDKSLSLEVSSKSKELTDYLLNNLEIEN